MVLAGGSVVEGAGGHPFQRLGELAEGSTVKEAWGYLSHGLATQLVMKGPGGHTFQGCKDGWCS